MPGVTVFTRCCCLCYQVARRPFSGAAMLGFVRILLLPLPTLRSCVQLMQMHMVSTGHACCQLRGLLTVCTLQVPLSGAVWRISLCLTVPQGIDLPGMGTRSLGHGSVGVVFRGKLLLVVSLSAVGLYLIGIKHLFFFLQVKMTHIQGDGGEHVLLLLYDPKTNQTFLPANSRGTVRSALFQAVDTVLKKTYQDHQSGKPLPVIFPFTQHWIGSGIMICSPLISSGHPRPDSSTLFASLKALSLATLPV